MNGNDENGTKAGPKRILTLRKEQVRQLSDEELEGVVGAVSTDGPDSYADCDTSSKPLVCTTAFCCRKVTQAR